MTHGHTNGGKWTRTYRSWMSARTRCNNPAFPSYAAYGAKGIRVCDRWSSFENFLADMGERPADTTLDRIDNSLGYEPGNCRWAGWHQQARNRRSTRLTLARAVEAVSAVLAGETQTSVAARCGVSLHAINAIVHGRNWPEARELASRALITTEQN